MMKLVHALLYPLVENEQLISIYLSKHATLKEK